MKYLYRLFVVVSMTMFIMGFAFAESTFVAPQHTNGHGCVAEHPIASPAIWQDTYGPSLSAEAGDVKYIIAPMAPLRPAAYEAGDARIVEKCL